MSSSGSLATLSLVAAIVFAGCTGSSDKRAATERYVSWYVEQQSGDAALARRLSNDLSAGWDAFLRLKREGRTSRDVADELKQMGYDVFLVGRGMNQRELPGQSVSFLVMNTEEGCNEIHLERWTAREPSGPTNFVLVGVGNEDASGTAQDEKQIHVLAVELPAQGEYLQIETQSISPLGKGIVAFGVLLGLTGCDGDDDGGSETPEEWTQPETPEETTETNPSSPNSETEKGSIGPADADIGSSESEDVEWMSWAARLSGSGALSDIPRPGRDVWIWLDGNPKIKIGRVDPPNGDKPIAEDGRMARGETGPDGKLTIQLDAPAGTTLDVDVNDVTVWGMDHAKGITKKLTVRVTAAGQ